MLKSIVKYSCDLISYYIFEVAVTFSNEQVCNLCSSCFQGKIETNCVKSTFPLRIALFSRNIFDFGSKVCYLSVSLTCFLMFSEINV